MEPRSERNRRHLRRIGGGQGPAEAGRCAGNHVSSTSSLGSARRYVAESRATAAAACSLMRQTGCFTAAAKPSAELSSPSPDYPRRLQSEKSFRIVIDNTVRLSHGKNYSRDRRIGVHRLQLHSAMDLAGKVSGGQSRQTNLRWKSQKPAQPFFRSAIPVCARRYLRPRSSARIVTTS